VIKGAAGSKGSRGSKQSPRRAASQRKPLAAKQRRSSGVQKKRVRGKPFKKGDKRINRTGIRHNHLRSALLAAGDYDSFAKYVWRQVKKGSIQAMRLWAEYVRGRPLSESEQMSIKDILRLHREIEEAERAKDEKSTAARE
jgi:hypothetical protein